jgi:hypothetical protein
MAPNPQVENSNDAVSLGDIVGLTGKARGAPRTRVLLVDADKRVIAASNEQGVLGERIEFDTGARKHGFCHDSRGHAAAFHETRGYETYAGLGWLGVIVQGSA